MALKKLFNRRGILIYPWYISDLVITKDIGSYFAGHKIKEIFFYISKGMSNMYYDQETTNNLGRWLLKQIIKNCDFYHRVINKIYYYSKELMRFSTKLEKLNPAQLSNGALLKIYSQYEKKLGQLRIWGWVPPILDGAFEPFFSDYIMEKLLEFLQIRGQSNKIANYYSLLSSSEKMSAVQTESLARLKLLIALKKKNKGSAAIYALKQRNIKDFRKKFPEITVLLDEHLKKFGWLTYAYSGPVMSFADLFKTLGNDLKNGDLVSQIQKIIYNFKTIKRRKAKLRTRLKLPAELSYLFKVSAGLMLIKDYRKTIYQKSYVAMDPIIAELAQRLGISNKEIRYLVQAELKEALLNNKSALYKRRAHQRLSLVCYTVKQGKIQVFSGAKAQALVTKIKSIERNCQSGSKSSVKLKGSIAYPGLVQGRAKIILVKSDVAKLKTGDILISSATNPDLIVAMKKAAAFVTDTGGIICHAAIVARELKKPCVIGTKIATQVLHDGDLIEVDANQGIVKILKKSGS